MLCNSTSFRFILEIMISKITKLQYTVFPLKNAMEFITKTDFWIRFLKEYGIYQRAAFITNDGLKM